MFATVEMIRETVLAKVPEGVGWRDRFVDLSALDVGTATEWFDRHPVSFLTVVEPHGAHEVGEVVYEAGKVSVGGVTGHYFGLPVSSDESSLVAYNDATGAVHVYFSAEPDDRDHVFVGDSDSVPETVCG